MRLQHIKRMERMKLAIHVRDPKLERTYRQRYQHVLSIYYTEKNLRRKANNLPMVAA